jgi:hypothetical protein
MRVNVANLAEILDNAVPGRKLAEKIKADRTEIDRAVALRGFALVDVEGTTYKIEKTPSTITPK